MKYFTYKTLFSNIKSPIKHQFYNKNNEQFREDYTDSYG